MNALNSICCCVLLAQLALPVFSQDDEPFTRVFDTGTALPETIPNETLQKRAGWKLIPEEKIDHRFDGDAVLLNDKLLVVFQKQHPGPAVYSRSATGSKRRATVSCATKRFAAGQMLSSFHLTENTVGGVRLEAQYQESGPGGLRFRLTTGEANLEIQSLAAPLFAQVQSDSRFLIVPDYFGDDLVYGAGTANTLLPAENFCLNLLGGEDAVLMSVWQSKTQDAGAALSSDALEQLPCSEWISCLQDKSVWLALLENPGIWHANTGAAPDSWKPPFAAKWRSTRVRANHLADSWDVAQGPGPGQSNPSPQGTTLSYLIDRSIATPLTAVCPTDVMRNTLGVGPCQYILACEGLGSQGDPTPNSVMTWVEKQFEQKRQRKAADDIRERVAQMSKHVAEAQTRIRRYASLVAPFQASVDKLPDPTPYRTILRDLEQAAAAGLDSKATGQRAELLAGQVVQLLGQGRDNPLAACRQLGEQLRAIGAIQDSALAKCRMAVRRLRQEARMAAERRPSEGTAARQLQLDAERALQ